jgi:hypothetical protein
MKRIVLVLAVFLASVAVLRAQNQENLYSTNMLDGTILPIQLSSTISLDKAVAGQPICARIAQDVLLENGVVLRRGTKVLGHVVSVTTGNPARIAFNFDKIEYSKSNSVAVATNLRALASNLEIESAAMPQTGSDRGTPSVWWNTVQVGGEGLYGSGPLTGCGAAAQSDRRKRTESAAAKSRATRESNRCGYSPLMPAAFTVITMLPSNMLVARLPREKSL